MYKLLFGRQSKTLLLQWPSIELFVFLGERRVCGGGQIEEREGGAGGLENERQERATQRKNEHLEA